MKLHPLLENLVPKTEDGLFLLCPGCSKALKHTQNWNHSLFWLECSSKNCNNETEIFQKAYSEIYNKLTMYIALEESEEIDGNFDFQLELNCEREQMIVSDGRFKSEKELFRCDFPPFESLNPSYLRKKIKFWMTFS